MGYRNYSTATSFIVDLNGHGDFTTITAAVAAAAVSGGAVFVMPGTYTESFTLPAKVSLSAYISAPNVFGTSVGAIVDGTVTISQAGECGIFGISLTNSGAAPALAITGAATGIATIDNCFIEGGTVAAINSSNHNYMVLFTNCLVLAPISDVISSTASKLNFTSCIFPNVGGTGAVILNGSNASGQFNLCQLGGPATVSNGGKISITNSQGKELTLTDASQGDIEYSFFQSAGTAITLTGTARADMLQTVINAGATPAISIGAGTTFSIDQGNVSVNGAGFAIAGTGNFAYGLIEFTNGNTSIDPGLTTTLNVVRPFATADIALNAIRGLSRYDSSQFTVDNTAFVQLNGSAVASTYVEDAGSATPAAGVLNIVGGAGITTSGAGNTVTITNTGAGITWHIVAVNTVGLANNGYITNSAGNIQVSLPTPGALGEQFEILRNVGGGSWTITQAAGQQIFVANTSTTLGAGGSITSTDPGDSIHLICQAPNIWLADSIVGNLTVV